MYRYLLLTALCTISACAHARPSAPDTAQVFGPGTISIDAPDAAYQAAFSPDGREFYFFRKVVPRREDYKIFVSRRERDGWSAADTVQLGASPSDLYPAIDPSNRYLVFSSYRPAPGDTSGHASAGIWVARREGRGFGAPVFAREATVYGNYHSGLHFDDNGMLRFGRSTHDYRGIGDFIAGFNDGVITSARANDDITQFRALVAPLNLHRILECPDKTCVIVHATPPANPPDRPSADLYVMHRDGNGWTRPVPLGAGVNTAGWEGFPVFSPDGKELIFVRDFRTYYHVSADAVLKR